LPTSCWHLIPRNYAEVKDAQRRRQALQKNRDGKGEARSFQDAPHPHLEDKKKKRKLGKSTLVSDGDLRKVLRMIPYQ
jgi:hypothetical protein